MPRRSSPFATAGSTCWSKKYRIGSATQFLPQFGVLRERVFQLRRLRLPEFVPLPVVLEIGFDLGPVIVVIRESGIHVGEGNTRVLVHDFVRGHPAAFVHGHDVHHPDPVPGNTCPPATDPWRLRDMLLTHPDRSPAHDIPPTVAASHHAPARNFRSVTGVPGSRFRSSVSSRRLWNWANSCNSTAVFTSTSSTPRRSGPTRVSAVSPGPTVSAHAASSRTRSDFRPQPRLVNSRASTSARFSGP